MTTRRFSVGLIGLSAATALTGALVLTAADAVDNSKNTNPPTSPTAAVEPALPCSADAAQYWVSAGLDSPCVHNLTLGTYEGSWANICIVTADAAERWIQAIGHPPCKP